jgi:AbrB family looped-hinge helix DNA binding protein
VSESEVVVNSQGRVTIPAQIRHEAGIEPGSTVVLHVEDGRIVLETRQQLMDRLRRDVAAELEGSSSAADELIADRRAEAARE